jgi:hypothetical protein
MQGLGQRTRGARFQRSGHGEGKGLNAIVREQIIEPAADRGLA